MIFPGKYHKESRGIEDKLIILVYEMIEFTESNVKIIGKLHSMEKDIWRRSARISERDKIINSVIK